MRCETAVGTSDSATARATGDVACYEQSGLQSSIMFILTISRVVHPNGVRPELVSRMFCEVGVCRWCSRRVTS